MPKCAFCGKTMVKGSGLLFVRKDGSANFFCGSKCQKNALRLKRSPHAMRWTEFFQREKQAEKSVGKASAGKRVVRKRGKRKRAKKKKKR